MGRSKALIEEALRIDGLSKYAKVTTFTNATNFKVDDLAGWGDEFFGNDKWYVFVARDAGGAGVAPDGELQPISDYTSSDGTFTHTAFTVNLAVGDEILILHEAIASAINSSTTIDAIKLKTDLINSDSGSATITGTDSDTIVPSSLPTKMHLSLDINALVANGADNTIEIKVGVAASERVVAYYNLVGDGADITCDQGSGAGAIIKQRSIDISNIKVPAGQQVIIANTKNDAGGDLAIPYDYLCGV